MPYSIFTLHQYKIAWIFIVLVSYKCTVVYHYAPSLFHTIFSPCNLSAISKITKYIICRNSDEDDESNSYELETVEQALGNLQVYDAHNANMSPIGM